MTLDSMLIGVLIIMVIYTVAVRFPLLTLEKREERTTVDVLRYINTCKFQECWSIVDVLYHLRDVTLYLAAW